MQKETILNYLALIKSDLRKKGIEKIGLFGSFARGEADPFSDIDIAIQLQKEYLKENDVWEYFNLIENIKKELLEKFSRRVDVYDLDNAGIIRDIISGDIIYV
jgi:predicted nucleotidyltransferase